MFFDEGAVQLQYPVLETRLTPGDLEELLSSLIQPENLASPNSGSQGSNRAVYTIDERKRRRMISNRESARRSRWRKKRHLENLTAQVNRLKLENREVKSRLGLIMHEYLILGEENDRLRSESIALLARFSDLCRILSAMHSQQNI